jgi:uncharacterized membrane protein YgdD (TMEM256/DUF423 family)
MGKPDMSGFLILAGGLIGFAAVGAAASARHLTSNNPATLELIDLASRYMLVHAAALIGTAILTAQGGRGSAMAAISGGFFILGSILFGGGLILWALTQIKLFDIAIPFGGTGFMLGWLALAISGVLRIGRRPS